MAENIEEVRKPISPDELASALNKKIEDAKKEQEEKLRKQEERLFELAYTYVKIISNAIAKVPNEFIGTEGGYSYKLDDDTNRFEGLRNVYSDSVSAFVYEDSVEVRIDFKEEGFTVPAFYDFDAINGKLDKYNISITPIIKDGEHCSSITVSYTPKKKKELENIDANVLDDISRSIENEQPAGFIPSTDSYDNIKPSSEMQTIDDITKRVTTPTPIGFVPTTNSFERLDGEMDLLRNYDISRRDTTSAPEGFVPTEETGSYRL